MKLALDVSAVPPRLAGAGRYIAELARRLPGAGVEATLVTRRDDATRWRDWSPGASLAPIVPSGRAPRLVYETWKLGVSEVASGVDVWHSPHYTMPHRRLRPTVVTIHDLTFFTNPEWHERSKVTFFRRAIRYAAEHADVLISVSDFTARQIDEFFPTHAPVVVAPHGVDLDLFTPSSAHDAHLLASHGLPGDVPYIFFLGTFEPRKGLDVLLKAFEAVSGADATVELWLAGQSGWGLEELADQISRHPAKARIRRLGFVDEALLPTLIRHSRCVAYPSRGEGFGLPVLEAMACGAPVVTTSDTVMSEVANDTAVLAPAGDAEALARALLVQLDLSVDERRERGVAARSRAELFTWEASMTMHLSAYDLARRGH
jgi:glycosyltransferase involved in cell wall biosynthesis